MYLERVTSKGNCYLYLKEYSVRKNYSRPYKTIYKFGRIETALEMMKEWENDFSCFPPELLGLGCTKRDLKAWIKTLETGKHTRTGREFDLVI